MLQQPTFIQNFGNVKIKIWSYPKDILRSLIIGLKRDSNTVHKISSVMGFKHVYNDFRNECNCKGKIENLCLKLSINAHRYGKIYIPLDLYNSADCSHCTFLCELKSAENRCKNHIFKTNNVISDDDPNSKCLLKLMKNSKNQLVEEVSNNPHCRACPENSKQEKYIKSSKNINRNKRFAIDMAKIKDLCLKFDVPPDEIAGLLKGFKEIRHKEFENDITSERYEDGSHHFESDACESEYKLIERKKILSDSRFSSGSRNNNRNPQCNNYQQKHTKYFTINRSPSPKSSTQSCIDDCETDFSRSISPDMCSELNETLRSGSVMKFRNQANALRLTSTTVERDIHDIKGILQEIIMLLRRKHVGVNCENDTQCDECMLEGDNCKTSQEIELLHSILEEWIRRKNIDLDEIKFKSCTPKKSTQLSKANQYQEFESNIPNCEQSKMTGYANQSLNLKSKDVNNPISLESLKVQQQMSFDKNLPVSSNDAIKSVLLSAGIPPNISDQIYQMTFGGKGPGVTNIYYYVNSNGEPIPPKPHKKSGKLYKETEIVIEQQKLKKLDKDEKSGEENFSQILVDFNNPQLKVDTDNPNLETTFDNIEVNVDERYSPIMEKESIFKDANSRITDFQNEPKKRSLKRVKQAKFDENNGCGTKKA